MLQQDLILSVAPFHIELPSVHLYFLLGVFALSTSSVICRGFPKVELYSVEVTPVPHKSVCDFDCLLFVLFLKVH